MKLPSFEKPPVTETVLGLQFETIPGFTNAHLGAFWSYLGGREYWPTVRDAAAVAPSFERFGEERQWKNLDALNFDISQTPPTRMQIQDASANRMVQIQRDRLVYNWTATQSGCEYVRYEKLRPEFDDILQKLHDFLKAQSLPPIQPNQWEVTYINQIAQGTVWNDASDWRKVFTFQAVPPAEVNGCTLENFSGGWIYEIAPQRGRLRLNVQHAWLEPNGKQILLFNLTARGPIKDGAAAVSTIGEGLEVGHEMIARSFVSLTSEEARKYWGQIV